MKILITGGTGYIGSHTCVELLNEGHNIVIIDNLNNSNYEVVSKIEKITKKNVLFYNIDLIDLNGLEKVFCENNFDYVIHFAGLKSVDESIREPFLYYKNNVVGTINLLEIMKKHNVKNIIFSSSATVYGYQKENPIKEIHQKKPINPYGRTKSMIEDMLEDIYVSDNSWSITVLRYFNPVGAHKTGEIGESPNGQPNNLMPIIANVAFGEKEKVYVYGNDYETIDGTGVRDYIHVVDLATAHVRSIDLHNFGYFKIYNVGTGKGHSVIDVIKTFNEANNVSINYEIVERRKGDVGCCYADPTKIKEELGWKHERNIYDMCVDLWNFKTKNKR